MHTHYLAFSPFTITSPLSFTFALLYVIFILSPFPVFLFVIHFFSSSISTTFLYPPSFLSPFSTHLPSFLISSTSLPFFLRLYSPFLSSSLPTFLPFSILYPASLHSLSLPTFPSFFILTHLPFFLHFYPPSFLSSSPLPTSQPFFGL